MYQIILSPLLHQITPIPLEAVFFSNHALISPVPKGKEPKKYQPFLKHLLSEQKIVTPQYRPFSKGKKAKKYQPFPKNKAIIGLKSRKSTR